MTGRSRATFATVKSQPVLLVGTSRVSGTSVHDELVGDAEAGERAVHSLGGRERDHVVVAAVDEQCWRKAADRGGERVEESARQDHQSAHARVAGAERERHVPAEREAERPDPLCIDRAVALREAHRVATVDR